MKHFFIHFSIFTCVILSFDDLKSQNSFIPQTINFQAVARDQDNAILDNRNIELKLTIKDKSGSSLYCAVYQTIKTNANGSFSLQINRGTFASACNNAPNITFEQIEWEKGNKMVQIEYRQSTSTSFTDLGSVEFASVPYAFSARTAERLVNFNIDNANNGDVIKYNSSTATWGSGPSNGVPVGTIISYAGSTPSEGWLICDGSIIRQSRYPLLYNSIGTTWGNGDQSAGSFNLPDLRGQFLRGWDQNANVDPDRDSRSSKKVGGKSGNQVGSYQSDQFQGHFHGTDGALFMNTQPPGGGASSGGGALFREPKITNPISDGVNGAPKFGKETRPANAYVLFLIKAE